MNSEIQIILDAGATRASGCTTTRLDSRCPRQFALFSAFSPVRAFAHFLHQYLLVWRTIGAIPSLGLPAYVGSNGGGSSIRVYVGLTHIIRVPPRIEQGLTRV